MIASHSSHPLCFKQGSVVMTDTVKYNSPFQRACSVLCVQQGGRKGQQGPKHCTLKSSVVGGGASARYVLNFGYFMWDLYDQTELLQCNSYIRAKHLGYPYAQWLEVGTWRTQLISSKRSKMRQWNCVSGTAHLYLLTTKTTQGVSTGINICSLKI